MPFPVDLNFLADLDTLVGLVFAAAIVILVADWRVALYAQTGKDIRAGLRLSQIRSPTTALLRIIAGALVVLILYVTLRRLTMERSHIKLL